MTQGWKYSTLRLRVWVLFNLLPDSFKWIRTKCAHGFYTVKTKFLVTWPMSYRETDAGFMPHGYWNRLRDIGNRKYWWHQWLSLCGWLSPTWIMDFQIGGSNIRSVKLYIKISLKHDWYVSNRSYFCDVACDKRFIAAFTYSSFIESLTVGSKRSKLVIHLVSYQGTLGKSWNGSWAMGSLFRFFFMV